MKTILILLLSLKVSFCAKILFVAPIPSYSHQIFFRKIWMQLAKSGHQLTVLSTDFMENAPKNVRQIDWHFAYELRHSKHNISKVFLDNEGNMPKVLNTYAKMLNEIADVGLSRPDVQELLKNKDESFDLVIAEFHHPVLFAFSNFFNCPYIGIASSDIDNSFHELLGNPIHPLLYPSIVFPHDGKLTFEARLSIAKFWLHRYLKRNYYDDSNQNNLIGKYFGNGMPPLIDIIRNVSLVLVNTNIVFDSRPLVPGVIRIGGGTHLEPSKPLPKDVEEFLDKAKNGVVYFSLGTNVRSVCLNTDMLNIFINTFKDLPYKVLWKFEVDFKNLSDNVKIYKWVPQVDVLRHKNVKAFITQAGLQSMDEAIFSQVPMVAIPFVNDQKKNAGQIERNGLGIYLDKYNMNVDSLKNAILEVINNGSYKNNVRNIANYIQDQPMTCLDTAIWWIEYVIRHKGTKHLWNFTNNLPLYQYLMLDVFLYLLLITIGPLYFIYWLGKTIYTQRISLNILKKKTN